MFDDWVSVWPFLAATASAEPPRAVPKITRVAIAELEIFILSPLSAYKLDLVAEFFLPKA